MSEPYSGAEWLGKQDIQELGYSRWYVQKAIDDLGLRPTILPRRGNARLFSPDQVRQIQRRIQEIIDLKLDGDKSDEE